MGFWFPQIGAEKNADGAEGFKQIYFIRMKRILQIERMRTFWRFNVLAF